MNDTFRHQGLRNKLVEKLASKGITDMKILDAINAIPRHLFMDNAFVDFAYQDKALMVRGSNPLWVTNSYSIISFFSVLPSLYKYIIT